MSILETERLILRRFVQEDLEDFYEYCKNPSVGPNAGWKPHNNKEESAQILEGFITGNEVLALIDKEKNKVIGSIGLHNDDMRTTAKVKMVGFVLSKEYWGKGIMTEAVKRIMEYAFLELKLELLSIDHYSFNTRSRRVIEKCGFKYEGTYRYAREIYDGTVNDIVCYSITKDEWYELVSRNNL
ncbi:MAG: GNAT family N-acetyltransferase [Firmicutes bacterium HGW-Firmicutes-1]|jgi:putative acetyltransferase|nr:MAG: GNAT family N-acetyltransferase [Firmicutes bacterium HGW-Firmicutes-1]